MSARPDRRRALAIRALSALLAAALPAAAIAGCGEGEEQPIVVGPATSGKPAAAPPPKAGAKPANAADAADAGADGGPALNLPPLPVREFQEADFSESDRTRDPFRIFVDQFAPQTKGKVTIQRTVLVDRYALDELKLVGVVGRGPTRALLVDPIGLGWVVKVGDFVGKAEMVHAGGPTGIEVPLNWRVDRIRDADVVFIREDPSHPEIPPSTRVIALRVDDGAEGQRRP
jgi:type IV pilus assembly protein PilP